MNARISFQNKMSKKQQETARELMQEQFRKEAEGHTRRLLKIVCIALNETEGFGKQRIARLMDEVASISNEHMTDEVFWTHADKRLQQMGVPFMPEDYDVVERW
jgi:FKBP-type peptidyl-prolyl cis-trans isomerase (trigger factor)